MGAAPDVGARVGRHAVDVGARLRRHGVAVRTRRRVRAVPDLRQRTLALRAAPRSRRSRLPAHVRRPDARSADAAVSRCSESPSTAASRTRPTCSTSWRLASGSCPRSPRRRCPKPTSIWRPATDASASDTRPRSRTPTLLALSRAGVTYISTRSIGFDHIDVDSAERVGITVENVAYAPDGVADYTLMLMLMAIRNAKSIIRRARRHDYRLSDVRGKDLRDLTVGVVGTGHIGTAVIERLHGFGCRVLAYDTSAHDRRRLRSLDELLRAERHRHAPPAAHRGDAPSHRSPADRADEARRVPRQHRTRRAARHRRAGRGAGERQAGRRGAGRARRRGRDLLRRLHEQAHRQPAAAAAATSCRT